MALYPKTIGACVDLLYKNRSKRIEMQRAVDTLKEGEVALEHNIRELLKQQGLDSGRGKDATASVAKRTVGHVQDWDKFQKYIKKTGEFDLMQRRINDAAYRERLEAGHAVPGVEAVVVESLSLTKSKKEK
jgi:hypothetical protein